MRVPARTHAWSATTATRPKLRSLPNNGIARATWLPKPESSTPSSERTSTNTWTTSCLAMACSRRSIITDRSVLVSFSDTRRATTSSGPSMNSCMFVRLRVHRLVAGLVDGPGRVVRRGIDRHQPQALFAGVADVVPRARGDQQHLAFFEPPGRIGQHRLALPLGHDEDLVGVVMHFLADGLARLQAHQHDLGMGAGGRDAAEVLVVPGLFANRIPGTHVVSLVWRT